MVNIFDVIAETMDVYRLEDLILLRWWFKAVECLGFRLYPMLNKDGHITCTQVHDFMEVGYTELILKLSTFSLLLGHLSPQP